MDTLKRARIFCDAITNSGATRAYYYGTGETLTISKIDRERGCITVDHPEGAITASAVHFKPEE